MPEGPQPLTGLGFFLGHPRLWAEPILATLGGILATVVLFALVTWWQWPGAGVEGWWPYTLHLLWALGAGGIAAVVGWFALLPILIGLAYEQLVRQIYRIRGVAVEEERTLSAIRSALVVLLRSLPWILLWTVLGFVLGWFFPPIGVWASQMGLAHLAILEAGDVALSLRGLEGRARWQWLQERRSAVLQGAVVGSLIGVGLGFTMIGWIVFVPALFTATALWIAGCEIRHATPADLSPQPAT